MLQASGSKTFYLETLQKTLAKSCDPFLSQSTDLTADTLFQGYPTIFSQGPNSISDRKPRPWGVPTIIFTVGGPDDKNCQAGGEED